MMESKAQQSFSQDDRLTQMSQWRYQYRQEQTDAILSQTVT